MLMIRNLPPAIMRHEVMEHLNRSGFVGCYDFCYLPANPRQDSNLGMAFVNFTTPAFAAALEGAWHARDVFGGGATVVSVAAARVQGLEANRMRFASCFRRLRDPRFQPFIFTDAATPASASAR
mmetsp:Transcript_128054/g.368920  ORF Transcript_128054/g.368920 Transcript_128054/m.368920 type:complete len:124 (-) Transcript_128054:179-550(-)